jgi:hypothetical protein
MTIISGRETTLRSNRFTLLHRTPSLRKCAVKITGLSGEFTTIPFKVEGRFGSHNPFEASEVKLTGIFQLIFGAEIQATTPEGVGTLDIVYEIRTGADV